jgi:hypothetical protein
MEVTLRHPHSRKVMLVGELHALQQQLILARIGSGAVAREEEETEVHFDLNCIAREVA